ncbi:hypothetical protein HBN50_07725 [Halobacteriovorax sp. GB3]|uniref:hypothetical protein n=1 Tax=Halobacteriovorax sp. GB3 TaxID=2719615 RepID=UPI0023610EE8|nr:hypothetical protein [Halobacteriovorax sp. GB3]MDD0852980.1 hypothetical protein [Halobacteriovorax sp. GB3]
MNLKVNDTVLVIPKDSIDFTLHKCPSKVVSINKDKVKVQLCQENFGHTKKEYLEDEIFAIDCLILWPGLNPLSTSRFYQVTQNSKIISSNKKETLIEKGDGVNIIDLSDHDGYLKLVVNRGGEDVAFPHIHASKLLHLIKDGILKIIS